MPGWSIKRVPDATYCGGSKIVTLRRKRKLAPDDQPLADVYALAFPTGLDFDPDRPAVKQASLTRFNSFVETMMRTGKSATDHYTATATGTDPRARAQAAARIAQVQLRLASLIVRAEIPRDVRTGEFAADKIAAYCDKMNEVGEPLVERGEEALGRCAALVADAPSSGWWVDMCAPVGFGQ